MVGVSVGEGVGVTVLLVGRGVTGGPSSVSELELFFDDDDNFFPLFLLLLELLNFLLRLLLPLSLDPEEDEAPLRLESFKMTGRFPSLVV